MMELNKIYDPVDFLSPYLIGQILVNLLQGIILCQYYYYIVHFWKKERPWVKLLVHSAFILGVLKFCYVSLFTWQSFVVYFGNYSIWRTFRTIAIPFSFTTSIPNAVCQVFYVYRGWLFGRQPFFLVPATVLLLLSVASCAVQTYLASQYAKGRADIYLLTFRMSDVSLVSGLICDFFITIFTCYYLWREKTGVAHADKLIFRLVRISIQAAAIPTFFALANLVLNIVVPDLPWFAVANMALAHSYIFSLLYTVNSRKNTNDEISTVVFLDDMHIPQSHSPSIGPMTFWNRSDPLSVISAEASPTEKHGSFVHSSGRHIDEAVAA